MGEVRYNTANSRTRCVIGRCFGLLKRRFPYLHLGLRTALANTLVIIVAAAVLHNFALRHREQDFDEDIGDENVPFDIVAAADANRWQCQTQAHYFTILCLIRSMNELNCM